jgi:ATP-dependent exoDNAse (exonuclease V) alpha subunit
MEQERVIELALAGHNIFLTGQAGTGKSYTLNKIIKKLRDQDKVVAVTASTGIASTHIDGSTIHSWAGIGIKEELIIDDLYKLKNNKFSYDRINSADVLIIDEISMLHDYRFDMVQEVCNFIKDKNKVFGGLQVIVCGDFFQLPPVTRGKKNKHYCFNAKSWSTVNFTTCYLMKIYRQESDLHFIEILNAIRSQTLTDQHLNTLSRLVTNTKNSQKAVNLYCKNVNVDIENNSELRKLPGEMGFHKMIEKTSKDLSDVQKEFKIKNLKKNLLVSEYLAMKEGAKVMTLVNRPKKGYVNGTLCEVVDLDEMEDGIITVKTLKDGWELEVEMHKWKSTEYDVVTETEKTVASVEQFPLKLAWAMTIHKAQGATFDFVNLDLSDTFEDNMGYVALSRVTTLDGLYLSGYNHKALQIDPIIIKKDIEFLEESKKYE